MLIKLYTLDLSQAILGREGENVVYMPIKNTEIGVPQKQWLRLTKTGFEGATTMQESAIEVRRPTTVDLTDLMQKFCALVIEHMENIDAKS